MKKVNKLIKTEKINQASRLTIISGLILISLVIGYFKFKYMWKPDVRQPAVAGQFYPASAEQLKQLINTYLEPVLVKEAVVPKALMVPHAGYIYSGSTAGLAYQLLINQPIKRVILMANSHHVYLNGAVIDDHDYWQTPLGQVKVDKKLAKQLIKDHPRLSFDRLAHELEHALEVQLPFLQTVLTEQFTIVPILFGQTNSVDQNVLAQSLANYLEPGDLIIASTDLSHYLLAKQAEVIDQTTLNSIIKGSVPQEDNRLCGPDAVGTILRLAKIMDWSSSLLDYRHSGHQSNDLSSVVGYGAIVWGNSGQLNHSQQQELLRIAQEAVEQFVQKSTIKSIIVEDPRLAEVNGVFVTINKQGQLRGCLGNVVGQQPLGQAVHDLAIAAATEDYRFNPVTIDELDQLEYEVSVLSRPQKISDWRTIKLGQEGVIVSKGRQSGVFLPQVATDTHWSLEEFLGHLCADKAGLSQDCYRDDQEVEIFTFTAQVF